jgi:hypothetical protein
VLAVLLALVACVAFCTTGASRADAFTGTNPVDVVVDSDGTLSAAAEQWLKDYGPAVESEWSTAGGARAAGDLSRFGSVLRAGRFLPLATDVLPPVAVGVATAVTAYEVCSSFVKAGCWLFSRDDTEPVGTWPGGSTAASFRLDTWVAVPTGETYRAQYLGNAFRVGALPDDVLVATFRADNGAGYRTTSYLKTQPAHPADCFTGATPEPYIDVPRHATAVFAQAWGAEVSGSGPTCPNGGANYRWGGTVFRDAADSVKPEADDPAIPNRSGVAIPAGSDWSTRVATELEKPANADVTTYIASQIDPTVPDPYKVAVPDPLPGETADAYVARLQELGLVGRIVTLTEATMDPTLAPGVIARTSPAQGTAVATGTEVSVYVNPDTAPGSGTVTPPAPPADGSGGGSGSGDCTPWVRPSIDLAPLNVPIGDVFPFAVPLWTYHLLSSWVQDAVAPKFAVPFPFVTPDPVIDLSLWDAAMPVWRGAVLFFAFVSLAWSFMSLALGGRAGGDD